MKKYTYCLLTFVQVYNIIYLMSRFQLNQHSKLEKNRRVRVNKLQLRYFLAVDVQEYNSNNKFHHVCLHNVFT